MDQAFLAQVVRQIEEHMGDTWFGADALAAEVHMSVSQLNRKLNALIGQTAGRLQRSIRLQRADDLLRQESGTVAEIAYAVERLARLRGLQEAVRAVAFREPSLNVGFRPGGVPYVGCWSGRAQQAQA